MHKILDHGYLKVIETWGSDERIVEAARMSTGKGFNGWGLRWQCITCKALWRKNALGWSLADESSIPHACCDNASDFPNIEKMKEVPGDEKLLRYLYENKHATPFEMGGMVIEVQAPIFVFREWHRHRTQSYNEMSARYVPLPDVNYIPTVERLLMNSKTNKQAGTIAGAAELTPAGAESFRQSLALMYKAQEDLYQAALRDGVPKELARVHLPLGRYSRMRASTNLRNWLAFLTLRMDAKAQWEIRQYATVLGTEEISKAFPRTWELFSSSST